MAVVRLTLVDVSAGESRFAGGLQSAWGDLVEECWRGYGTNQRRSGLQSIRIYRPCCGAAGNAIWSKSATPETGILLQVTRRFSEVLASQQIRAKCRLTVADICAAYPFPARRWGVGFSHFG